MSQVAASVRRPNRRGLATRENMLEAALRALASGDPASVPANRIGSAVYSTAELKTMQEVITLTVFAGFSVFWLKESLTWNHAIGFALIAAGAFFIFHAKG